MNEATEFYLTWWGIFIAEAIAIIISALDGNVTGVIIFVVMEFISIISRDISLIKEGR